MSKELVLILGGARSGKSAFAQRLAEGMACQVLYVATGEAKDKEMAERIRHHKATRPDSWHTLEEPIRVVEALQSIPADIGVVLLDCLGLWVANQMVGMGEEGEPLRLIMDGVERLLSWCEEHQSTLILVSNEVGMGVVPPYPSGRQFRDLLGRVNQRVAARADRVYLLVAGLPLEIKSLAGNDEQEPEDTAR